MSDSSWSEYTNVGLGSAVVTLFSILVANEYKKTKKERRCRLYNEAKQL